MRLLHVSRLSRKREEDTGFERQEESCLRYATAHGHDIVAVAEDPNVSGDRDPFERPGLGPWLRTAKIREYDGIIAAYLDRLGRNARQLSRLRDWAEDHGKKIIVVSPSLEWPPSPEDLASPIIWDVLSRLAEYELAAIARRNRETVAWLRANGYLHGRFVWGYRVVPHPDDPKRKTLAVDEDLRPVLRGMVERAIAGRNMAEIARWLDASGVPTPAGGAHWRPESVRQILKNPTLAGRRQQTRVPPVVSAEEWHQLQKALESRSRNRPVGSRSMLSGRLRCLNGHKMYERVKHRTLARGRKKTYRYYGCPHACVNVTADHIEGFVDRLFTAVLGDTERTETVTVPGRSYEAEVALIEAELRTLDYDAPDFLERQSALLEERRRLRSLPREPDQTEEIPTGEKMVDWWRKADPLERRAYLRDHDMYFIVAGKGDYRPAWLTTRTER